jgi:ribosomal-protein-alanine N-acetyltransferase
LNAKKNAAIPWKIRPTERRDQSIVAKLLANAPDRHLHLDWYTTIELLNESPSLLAFDEQRAVAILACPPDPERISWIRYFAVSEGTPTIPIWEALWQHTLGLAPKAMISTIAALVTQSWFTPILSASGFTQTTEVIFLEWDGEGLRVDLPLNATLRTMSLEDLDTVARVDRDAFQPLWQHSLRALKAAYQLSSLATVIEVDQEIVAYQISTSSALGAHLARLAVDPRRQGQGIARALVNHAFRHFQRRGIERMSVNTQADNSRSQLLYEKLGFMPTGQRFPVYTYTL